MQTDRDRSLVEHLATKVKGWHRAVYGNVYGKMLPVWSTQDGADDYAHCVIDALWNPLDSWADAGALWEKAQAMPSVMNRVQEWLCRMNVGQMPSAPFLWFLEKASPRVLSEAVAWATGWEEPK